MLIFGGHTNTICAFIGRDGIEGDERKGGGISEILKHAKVASSIGIQNARGVYYEERRSDAA